MTIFKKGTLLGLIAFLAIGFNGCISAIEEITFNRDGSGSYALNYDLSAMMSMIGSMGDMGGLGGDDADEEGMDEEAEREPVKQDTTIHFYDQLNDEMKANLTADELKFWEGVKMDIKMDEDEGEAKMKIYFDFDRAEQVTYFQQNMQALNNQEGEGDAMGGMSGLISQMGSSPDGATMDFKGRSFKRFVPKASLEDLMKDEDADDEAEQAMQMMKMMFGSATYKVVYHFPRKVKSTDIEDAMISSDGKTVIKEYNFLDILEGNATLSGKVKLKRN